mmetsp:Transcript_29157/g.82214  ORF Transcript_29157/g.82214 Transcript_29157/m.82214 type:complete len:146 (-) Transcript_29157:464-901(-)
MAWLVAGTLRNTNLMHCDGSHDGSLLGAVTSSGNVSHGCELSLEAATPWTASRQSNASRSAATHMSCQSHRLYLLCQPPLIVIGDLHTASPCQEARQFGEDETRRRHGAKLRQGLLLLQRREQCAFPHQDLAAVSSGCHPPPPPS